MLQIPILRPIEMLLSSILNQYFNSSFCLTMVLESPLDVLINNSFTYIDPGNGDLLVNQILEVSEMGCSDYVVRMGAPEKFMVAFDKVNHLGKVRRSDRKVLFLPLEDNSSLTRTKLEKILLMKETSFLANILLILPVVVHSSCRYFDLVTQKYVGPDDQVNKPYYLDRWNSCSSKFEYNNNLFPHGMTDLQGKIVKVACYTYKPFVLLDIDPSIEPLGRDGIEVRIVDEFCRWINCSIEIIPSSGDVYHVGELNKTHTTEVGVIGNVVEDRVDIGMSALGSWYEEYRFLDFSASLLSSDVICLAPSPRLLPSWSMPLRPLNWYIWLALVFTFVYASLGFIIAKGFSTDTAFLTSFGVLIAQPQSDKGAPWRLRSIVGWLLLSALVFENAYSAGLASVLTVPTYENSIDTVQDMVDNEVNWGAIHADWVFSLSLSSEPSDKKLVSQFRLMTEDVMKNLVGQRSMALAAERLSAGNFAVGDYITREAMLGLTLMRENLYKERFVMMLRKSSPYTKKISELIIRLHESGLILAWESQVTLKYLDYDVQLKIRLSRLHNNFKDRTPLNLSHLVGVFIVYAVGVAISTMLFILEVVLHEIN